MGYVGRGIEALLGAFFLLTAGLKAANMDAFAVSITLYGIVKDPDIVRTAAYGTVALEALLGGALVAGARLKGLTHAAAGAMTLVFSGFIIYAFDRLEDCGCFGGYIKAGPLESLIKNGVLLVALGGAWYGARKFEAPKPLKSVAYAAGALGALVVAGTLLLAPGKTGPAPAGVNVKDRPFAKFIFEHNGEPFNLGEGVYLVAMLSATCPHCRASVPGLNEMVLVPELPRLVALMEAGGQNEMDEFFVLTEPQFPIYRVPDVLDFFRLVDPAPPRLYLARDGRAVRHWDWEDDPPPAAEVLDAVRAEGLAISE